MDRGGDRPSLFNPLLDDGQLECGGKARSALEAAQGCPMSHAETTLRERDGKPSAARVEFGARRQAIHNPVGD